MQPILAPQGFRGGAHTSSEQVEEIMQSKARVKKFLLSQVSPFILRPCPFCSLDLLPNEVDYWCCGKGQRMHRPWLPVPQELQVLAQKRRFGVLSRCFNSLFCLAILHSDVGSPGLNYHTRGGPPCMRVSGSLYARMMRTSEHCWFLSDANFPIAFRSLSMADREMAKSLAIMLRSSSPLAGIMFNLEPRVNSILLSSADVVQGSIAFADDPDSSTICAVYVGPSTLPPRRLMLHPALGSRRALDESSPLWEVLVYPLFHPQGDTSRTWREGYLPLTAPSRQRRSLSLLEYLRSVMLYEPLFWRFSRLAQQYVLDTWSRNEQMLAKVWKSESVQSRIREAVRQTSAETIPTEKIFLPPSVPGSRRYQLRFVQDAMYITSVYGNPHLFLTFTANPHWPEISAMLQEGQQPNDRPDIVVRVFHQRRKKLIRLLKTPNYLFEGHLGIEFLISATEFQLCGFPHWHAAVRLKIDPKIPMLTVYDQLMLMDRIISAKLPPEGTYDRDLVQTYMLHNDPCDERCCRKRKDGSYGCRFYFPKEEAQASRIDKKGFPVYQRGPEDKRVVPHVLKLLRDMQCHCDTEWTFGSGSIGYLYKYFSKHADSTGVKISEIDDEIAAFRLARILTCSEAIYRSFCYQLNIREPSVVLCKFSIPRKEMAEPSDIEIADVMEYLSGNPDGIAPDGPEAEEAESDERDLFGDLKDYFDRPVECEDLMFTEFFKDYYMQRGSTKVTFHMRQRMFPDLRNRFWIRRNHTNVLARMPLVPIHVGEAYYLRMLLLNQTARSYDDLYGGYTSFRKNAEVCGLVQTPMQNMNALREAISEKVSSYELRRLYVLMIFYCEDMRGTWQAEDIRTNLTHDFQPESRRSEEWDTITAETLCTLHLYVIANKMQREIQFEDCGIPCPPESADTLNDLMVKAPSHADLIREYAQIIGTDLVSRKRMTDHSAEIHRYRTIFPPPPLEQLTERVNSLKAEQMVVFNRVSHALQVGDSTPIHVDAPAGCGKTYLCQTIMMYARYQKMICLPCATTGIAALHYQCGQTAHSLFKLPLKETPDVLEGEKFESLLLSVLRKKDGTGTNTRIELLRACNLIIWDEICMAHKRLIIALDKLLRKVMNKPHIPFGGKLLITLGDWRQVCPVDSDRDSLMRRRSTAHNDTFATSAFHTTILSSPLWNLFSVLRLTENIRQLHDAPYHTTLLRVGNGELGPEVPLDQLGIRTTTDFDMAISWLFETSPETSRPYDPELCHKRTFICPFNSDVDMVNDWAATRLCAIWKVSPTVMKAVDSEVKDGGDTTVQEQNIPTHNFNDEQLNRHVQQSENALLSTEMNEVGNIQPCDDYDLPENFAVAEANNRLPAEVYSPEVIRKQYFDGVPQADLALVPGMIVMLLRNIDPSRRLMNGVRVEVVRVRRHVVIVKHIGETAHHVLPRIKFDVTVGADKLHFNRMQVPLRLAYSSTIHKSQAATLDRVVVDLRNGVFDHGQLYVALSRVRSREDILVLIAPGQEHVLNIVHHIILRIGGVIA